MTVATVSSPASSGFGLFVTQLLSDRERLYAEIEAGEGLGAKLAYAFLTLAALTALYGAAAGAYAGPAQALSAELEAAVGHFGCPVIRMRYESAELTKTAINLYLCAGVT